MNTQLRKNKSIFKLTSNIDWIKDGVISGWFFSGKNELENIFFVRIDNEKYGPFIANIYREDLNSLGYSLGCASFKVNLPVAILDDKNHSVEIICSRTDQVTSINVFKFNTHPTNEYLTSLVINSIAYPKKQGKKCLILAGYSPNGRLQNYQINLLEFFYKNNFSITYSLALDTNNFYDYEKISKYCSFLLIRKNKGYDFGSWAHGYLINFHKIKDYEYIYFGNDSIVGPIGEENFLAALEENTSDICSITDSYDRQWHLQSYFWRINKDLIKSCLIDNYFFYRHPLPETRDDAITNFELALGKFFIEQGRSASCIISAQHLHESSVNSFLIKFNTEMDFYKKNIYSKTEDPNNPYYEMIIKKYLNYFTTLKNNSFLNPTHHYWSALISHGFPFIKKEFVLKNPTNYPIPSEVVKLFLENNEQETLIEILRKNNIPSIDYNI
jgi:hypothetical protein